MWQLDHEYLPLISIIIFICFVYNSFTVFLRIKCMHVQFKKSYLAYLMVNPLKILNEGCQIIKDNTGFLLEFYWLMHRRCGYWKVCFR